MYHYQDVVNVLQEHFSLKTSESDFTFRPEHDSSVNFTGWTHAITFPDFYNVREVAQQGIVKESNEDLYWSFAHGGTQAISSVLLKYFLKWPPSL